jgi:hypothetical protein
MQNSEGSKKRRRTEKETKVSANKRIKPLETAAEDNSDSEVSGNASEDNNSPSSAEKPVKVLPPHSPIPARKKKWLFKL